MCCHVYEKLCLYYNVHCTAPPSPEGKASLTSPVLSVAPSSHRAINIDFDTACIQNKTKEHCFEPFGYSEYVTDIFQRKENTLESSATASVLRSSLSASVKPKITGQTSTQDIIVWMKPDEPILNSVHNQDLVLNISCVREALLEED